MESRNGAVRAAIATDTAFFVLSCFYGDRSAGAVRLASASSVYLSSVAYLHYENASRALLIVADESVIANTEAIKTNKRPSQHFTYAPWVSPRRNSCFHIVN